MHNYINREGLIKALIKLRDIITLDYWINYTTSWALVRKNTFDEVINFIEEYDEYDEYE
jgi:hypothetical protein